MRHIRLSSELHSSLGFSSKRIPIFIPMEGYSLAGLKFICALSYIVDIIGSGARQFLSTARRTPNNFVSADFLSDELVGAFCAYTCQNLSYL